MRYAYDILVAKTEKKTTYINVSGLIALTVETTSTFETSVNFHQIALRINPQDSHLHIGRSEKLKSHLIYTTFNVFKTLGAYEKTCNTHTHTHLYTGDSHREPSFVSVGALAIAVRPSRDHYQNYALHCGILPLLYIIAHSRTRSVSFCYYRL